MASKKGGRVEPTLNPLVGEALSRAGNMLSIGGYIGPAAGDNIRIYADLGLSTYVELSKSDIIRIVDSRDGPEKPSIIYFNGNAQLSYVESLTIRADQLISAMAFGSASKPSCRCADGQTEQQAIARRNDGGPIVDICTWSCDEQLELCKARSGPIGRLWCYLRYGTCRIGCFDPIVVA